MSPALDELVAMVLTAGRGRRMRPLSDVLPKPALPILDRPAVGWALDLALRSGAQAIAANVWHLPHLMEAAIRSASAGRNVGISYEPELLGGAGGLAAARDLGLLEGRGPVLVLNGDSLSELDLAPLFERHRHAGDLVTLALLPHPDPGRWSRIQLDASDHVSTIVPPGAPADDRRPWLYPGVMLVARELVDALPTGPGGIAEKVWAPARHARRMGGAAVSGRWREAGTPQAYRAAVLDALGGVSWQHPTATVAASAHLVRSMAGNGVTIGPRTTVRDSVLSHGAVIGARCRLDGCIVLGPVRIDSGSMLSGAILVRPLPSATGG